MNKHTHMHVHTSHTHTHTHKSESKRFETWDGNGGGGEELFPVGPKGVWSWPGQSLSKDCKQVTAGWYCWGRLTLRNKQFCFFSTTSGSCCQLTQTQATLAIQLVTQQCDRVRGRKEAEVIVGEHDMGMSPPLSWESEQGRKRNVFRAARITIRA